MMAVELKAKARPLFDPPILRRAAVDALRKLDPRIQVRNPVMFIVEAGAVLTTGLFIQALAGEGEAPGALRLRRGCGLPSSLPLRRSHGGRTREGIGRCAA
jgi:hypothetical protein